MATVRYLTDWLNADRSGVKRINEYLRDVPLFPGDTLPADLALVIDPYRPGDPASDRCARFDTPAAFPALYVIPDGPVPTEGEIATIHRDSYVAVAIRYIVRSSDAARSAQSAAYTMKALERAMRDFFAETEDANAARGYNSDAGGVGVAIIACTQPMPGHLSKTNYGMAYGPWKEKVGDAVANQVFMIDMLVRDLLP